MPNKCRIEYSSGRAKKNRERVAAFRKRKRETGFIAKERWAHPDDWPEIDALIKRLNAKREKE